MTSILLGIRKTLDFTILLLIFKHLCYAILYRETQEIIMSVCLKHLYIDCSRIL